MDGRPAVYEKPNSGKIKFSEDFDTKQNKIVLDIENHSTLVKNSFDNRKKLQWQKNLQPLKFTIDFSKNN